MSDLGWIYVLINPSMEGLTKIGKTTRDPKYRVRELSNVTGVPTPFILAFDTYRSYAVEGNVVETGRESTQVL